MHLSIQDFWKRRLTGLNVLPNQLVKGWRYVATGYPAYKEAPLLRSIQLSTESDPSEVSVLMVSAPGAVGKSTLARQIALETGAIYIDLVEADAVGGNTLSGGIFRSGVGQEWNAQTTAVLIDGLDEARLRVTQEAFEAFLADVAAISKGRRVPTVLFGRTGAIQDAWLMLTYAETQTAVLEIGFYDSDASVDFAEASLRVLRPNSQHKESERRAIAALLGRLRQQTAGDGDRFAGYAPVLQAVAKRVADESNPSALIAAVESGDQPVTLQTVASAILERERAKLANLPFDDSGLRERLYSANEQLERLAALVYRLPTPNFPSMSPKDSQTYSEALKTWVVEHPFLDGSTPSSAVFDAIICTSALTNPISAPQAIQKELRRGAAANPFLSEFYLTKAANAGEAVLTVPPEHVGIVYASLRAGLSIGDAASLLVEGAEDAPEEESLKAEVEITISRRGVDQARTVSFVTDQTDILRLGPYLEDIEINAPFSAVEVGPGAEAVLVAPVNILCDSLRLLTDKVIVEQPLGATKSAVYIEAGNFDGSQMVAVPTTRGDVSFTCAWPGVQNHPWTSFASSALAKRDPRMDEALRRLRKFVTAFRSHSKGNLRRYQDKIEHARMTKGTGAVVLDLLKSNGILFLVGNMYELNPDLLGSIAGTTYVDCMSWKFSQKTVAFLDQALSGAGK